MPCFKPIAAVQPYPGAQPLLFGPVATHGHLRPLTGRIDLPCNDCIGCFRRTSLEWACRCVHEAQMHRYNSYITLTYDDNNLPANNSLHHPHFVRFMKDVRHAIARNDENLLLERDELSTERTSKRASRIRDLTSSLATVGPDENQNRLPSLLALTRAILTPEIKFYMAGEYGEKYGRPHYHSLLFGVDFRDKTYHGKTKAGEKIYRSYTLEKLWPYGYSSIGAVTFNSAAYISRYIMKKRRGDGNTENYEILDLETGEIYIKKKEYNCMSRAEGIGKAWLEEFTPDVYHRDRVITKQGRELRPPRYYDKLYKKMDAAHLQHLKHARELEALAQKAHHTPARLAVQEEVAKAKARFQTRNFE